MYKDSVPIIGIDHLTFVVGNAFHAAKAYEGLFGFKIEGYRGPETGCGYEVSYFLKQGTIQLVFTTPLDPSSQAGQFKAKHPDGVMDVAFLVPDAKAAYDEIKTRPAKNITELVTTSRLKPSESSLGSVSSFQVGTYGDVHHSVFDRQNYSGLFLPGFVPYVSPTPSEASNILWYVDHVVGNVEKGKMNEWIQYYSEVFDFKLIFCVKGNEAATTYGGFMSKVAASQRGVKQYKIRMPFNEPFEAVGGKRNQIQAYIDDNKGPGVQHVAFGVRNEVRSVDALLRRGLFFQDKEKGNTEYYTRLAIEFPSVPEQLIKEFEKRGILVDGEEEGSNAGHLYQIFTQMMVPGIISYFHEIIQRNGHHQGFGLRNFQRLAGGLQDKIDERDQGRGLIPS